MKISKELRRDFILLGLQIKKLRKDRSITLKVLSTKTGIRQQYLQKIEDGKAYGVKIEKHLLKIATSLSVTMAELFNFSDQISL